MEKTTIQWNEAQQIAAEQQAKEKQWAQEFKQIKAAAKKEVLERIYGSDIPFTYADIEEIMSGHGLEMDYIEEFLF